MSPSDAFRFSKMFNATAAVFLNVFLIFLVVYRSHSSMCKYKYLIIAFAVFEASDAVLSYFGTCIIVIADRSWLIFSPNIPFDSTFLSILLAGRFCAFYEIWVGFICTQFIYRYIVVCRPSVARYVDRSRRAKIFIAVIWLLFASYVMLCSFFLCTRLELSENLIEIVKTNFGVSEPSKIGYILLRKRLPDNSISITGTTTIVNHFLVISTSALVALFCGCSIWTALRQHRKNCRTIQDTAVQGQIFLSLVIQTVHPLIFCHIPAAIYLAFPLWEANYNFGTWSLIGAWMSSASRWLDPLIVILCMRQYRVATINFFRGEQMNVEAQGSIESNSADFIR